MNLAIHTAIVIIVIVLSIGQYELNFIGMADATVNSELNQEGGNQPLNLTISAVAASFGVAALIQFVIFLLTRKRKKCVV
jgi:hypothetical protein